MTPHAEVIERYLARHAEPESRLANVSPDYGHVLTVPVYAEGESFFRLLDSVTAGPLGRTLVIAVVNARDDSSPDVVARNRTLLARVQTSFPSTQLGKFHYRDTGDTGATLNDTHETGATLNQTGATLIETGATLHETPFGDLLCIDRSTHVQARLPKRRGVGLARKIAADLALALHASGKLASPWIHFSDADAILPVDYFSRLLEQHADDLPLDAVAAVYPYRHEAPNPELERAGALYEMFMRHYVAGLARAGSRYAYHSIGSIIAVAAGAYAMVRGMPSRHGAEDFYLLNKLAKLGCVARLGGEPLRLEARASGRVPFGTGPAIRRLMSRDASEEIFYHPMSFRYLEVLLEGLSTAVEPGFRTNAADLLVELGLPRGLDASLLREMAEFLDLDNMLQASLARSKHASTRARDLHTNFDALRTLKLLHWLRDRALPLCHWRDALSPFGISTDCQPEEALAHLITHEQARCVGCAGWLPGPASCTHAPPID